MENILKYANGILIGALVVIPTAFGVFRMPTEMSVSATAIAVALLFLNVDKFELFKALGIEARMRDRTQGKTNKPLLPPTPIPDGIPGPLSGDAKKVLATLWRYQHQVFGDDNTKRWTFGVNPLTAEFPKYLEGLSQAVSRGWVVVSPETYQCMLTNEGLAYVEHQDDIRNSSDFYVF